MENEVIELEYSKPKLYKRYMACIIDIVLTCILGMLIFAFSGFITSKVPSYQEKVSERENIQVSSSLYTSEGESILIYVDNDEKTYKEKKDYLSNSIESFYHNELFFTIPDYYNAYQERKRDYQNSDGKNIFVLEGDTYKENPIYLDKDFYDFYYKEVEKYCTGYLFLNQRYKELSSNITILYVVLLAISFMISFLVFFFVIPLILKRGRRTLGMFLFKIGLISSDALNLSMKQYLIRSLFVFFIGFILDLVTVFVPLLVSITMMHLSKTGQDFFDYMSGSYMVDISRQDIYLDYQEYEKGVLVHKEKLLENEEYQLKN